jgi:subtilase family serine protease
MRLSGSIGSALVESQYALGLCAAIAMLAGCSGSQSALGTPGPIQQSVVRGSVVIREKGANPDAPVGLSPADLQSAYDLPSTKKGSGQIVAVVEPYDNPDVASDLAKYRSTFRLPKANFTKYNQDGVKGNYPEASPDWALLHDLDVDMVSASCPNCTIYLIEANSTAVADLEAATAEAVTLGAHIISLGFGCSTSCDNSYFDAKGVTYLAPGSDAGSAGGYPDGFSSVVSSGGTMLSQGGGKRGWSEAVWSGYGGGCVTSAPKPQWQHDSYCEYRLTNDVASVAVNLAEYDTYDQTGWFEVDSTYATAPFLAGVFGLAGNATKQDGGRTFWQSAHRKDLYPVTAGDNVCKYIHGRYNTCTGWGSPHGIGAF